jgi:single-strand DNA-binding protein
MFNGTITGHLGRDPELRFLNDGQQVANFTVAVRQNKRSGQDQPARWVKVAVWGKAAEYVGNYVKKGDGVMCIGRVEAPELFTRRDGTQGMAEVFTAENIEKWSNAGEPRQQPAHEQQAPAAAAAPAPAPAPAPVAQQQPAPPAAPGWGGTAPAAAQAPAWTPQQQAYVQPPAQPGAQPPVWQSSEDPPF